MEKIDFNAVLHRIGTFGRYQKVRYFFLCFVPFIGGIAAVSWVFQAYDAQYRCRNPYCESADLRNSLSYSLEDGSFPAFVDEETADQCQYLDLKRPILGLQCDSYVELLQNANDSDELMVAKSCSHDLVFDRSIVESSLTETFSLVCESRHLRSIVGSSYMVGMLVGSLLVGILSDKFGRLKALVGSVLCVTLGGLLCGVAPNLPMFVMARFIKGIGGIGSYMCTFVIAVEMVGPKYTNLLGLGLSLPFPIGEAVFGTEAYFIRDWSLLTIVAFAPLIPFAIGLAWIVPESPRWLLTSGKTEEAVKMIKEMGKVNGRPISEKEIFECNYEEKLEEKSSSEGVLSLFRNRKIGFRLINMSFQWFSLTLCYYGLSYASTSLNGDPHLNFFLNVAIEVPAYIFGIIFADCWGRRPLLVFVQIISGLACIGAGLLFFYDFGGGLDVLQVCLSLLGKFGASATFGMIYVYTAELFPTPLRNSTIGTCSMVARIAGIFSFLIQALKNYWKPLPMVLMGGVTIVAGFSGLAFPETVGEPLPDTIADAVKIGKENPRSICSCQGGAREKGPKFSAVIEGYTSDEQIDL